MALIKEKMEFTELDKFFFKCHHFTGMNYVDR